MNKACGWAGVWLLALGTLTVAGPVLLGGDLAVLTRCEVQIFDEVKLPARAAGALLELSVREGTAVQAGQVVGRIDDEQAQIEWIAATREKRLADTQATDESGLAAAIASLELAKDRLKRAQTVSGSSTIFGDYDKKECLLTVRRDEATVTHAQYEMKVAKLGADVREAAVRATEAAIRRRQVVSPLDGIVVERIARPGEWVDEGAPILHIVRMDRLYVDGFIDVADHDPGILLGRTATVRAHLAGGRQPIYQGRVAVIHPLSEQNGRVYRIRVAIDNTVENGYWTLLPGMSVAMTIHEDAADARSAAQMASRPAAPTANDQGSAIRPVSAVSR